MFTTLKQLVRIFTTKDFPQNPSAPSLNDADSRALLIGLINSEQLTAYTDSLTTGLPKDRVLQGLSEAWGIDNGEEAREILEWLLQAGHRVYYNEILPLLGVADPEQRNNLLEEKFGEYAPKAMEFAGNLAECMAARGGNGFVAFNGENMKKGILSWDLGRLVIVARLSFDAGYVDEQTAWKFIRDAYEMAIREYSNWKDLAVSYLIGRGMFGGDSMMLNGLYSIAEKSIEADNSPWKHTSLR
jgi:hypothetical protein